MGTAESQSWRQPGLPRDAAGLSERCCRVVFLAVLCRTGVKCHRVPRDVAGLSVVSIQLLCQQHCSAVQCSHGTSLKPGMPSLCPHPAGLTPYTPHSFIQTISVLHPLLIPIPSAPHQAVPAAGRE